MIPLSFPLTEERIRALRVGAEIELTGPLFTGGAISSIVE